MANDPKVTLISKKDIIQFVEKVMEVDGALLGIGKDLSIDLLLPPVPLHEEITPVNVIIGNAIAARLTQNLDDASLFIEDLIIWFKILIYKNGGEFNGIRLPKEEMDKIAEEIKH